ncbi:MAG TPA: DNA polymerase III subunit gamma/tau [Candidatus Eisenbacteria bacterium]|nr:DNA polymerase III subunit gamma/tau [Candidatus Eisenbacteria bacterium]
MEHRALALEYRPQRFDEVTGQHHVTAVLSRALANGRVHAAYLFSGPRGVGKTTTARILAKVLNCPNVKDGVPDNTCDVCRDITAGVSLDVMEIDGASNRGIADVQQLREKVRFAPVGGRYKVVIIDEVHQLSADAFAALLKTLEEPPPNVVFIFATTDPLKLPDTIRSRCQRYDFGRLPLPAVVERIRQIVSAESGRGDKVTITDEAAFLLARKSEGSMRDAVSALDQVLSTGVTKVDEAAVNEVLGLVPREIFFALGERILARDPEGALASLHRAYREGSEPRDLAEGLLDHLRSLLVLRVDPAAEDLLAASPEERARLLKQGAEHETADLLRLMRIITEALADMRDSAQPLTHLETAVVEMALLEPGVRLNEILDRLGGGGSEGGGARPKSAPAPAPARAPEPPPTRRRADAPVAAVPIMTAPMPAPPAAPAPKPAEAPLPINHTDSDWDAPGLWERVVSEVKDRKIMVGVFLAESRRAGWEESTLRLAADEVHKSLLEARENRELLGEVMARVYGRPLSVRFVDAAIAPAEREPGPRVVVAEPESEREKASAPAARIESVVDSPEPKIAAVNGTSEAAISPEVKQAMVWFEGEIVRRADSGGVHP